MSLDDLPAELNRRIAAEVKSRSDFISAVHTLHLAVVVAIETLDEKDLRAGEAKDRFASALEVGVSHLESRLSNDERDQYRRLYKYFKELLNRPSSPPGDPYEAS